MMFSYCWIAGISKFGVVRDEYYHELVLDGEMVKAKGKGLKKAKNTKESVDDVSGSDTESALRQAILDNTRQDPLDTEASGSGLNQNEDVNDGEDDVIADDFDDDNVSETAEEEAARKKKEEAVRKKEAAAKKKAADKKAEDAKKAKKAAEVAKEKDEHIG